jgi:methylphosphotriester-DNA--protein-cysteine methyltransferase
MIKHANFETNKEGVQELHRLIRQGKIVLAGNLRLKIYGTLACRSGKKMLRKNRVFFQSETDALQNGFRPCGHCLKKQYSRWKTKKIS